MTHRYCYVGSHDLADPAAGPAGVPVESHTALDTWLAARHPRELDEPFTFVVDLTGRLLLAPRRSEHVACAGGADVLAAGEIGFTRTQEGWTVGDVTNQSAGYGPDLDSWPAVAAALDRAGVPHPGGFTTPVVFRMCTACGQLNIVHDGDFTCAVCGAALPPEWNLATPPRR